MTDKIQPKDEALEALDFIVNVLKEHEKDLDRLINELGTVTEQIGGNGEFSDKIETVNKKIDNLQKELTKIISQAQNIDPPAQSFEQPSLAPAQLPTGPQLTIKCSNWLEFQNIAARSQMLSFSFKETEHTFEVNAVKGNQFITYNGELPKLPELLKCWLSTELSIPEKSMLQGILSLSQ
jgi:hypothetical protein